jgi:hypothetical protein
MCETRDGRTIAVDFRGTSGTAEGPAAPR